MVLERKRYGNFENKKSDVWCEAVRSKKQRRVDGRVGYRGVLLLFYRAASEGWQPPMSIEDTRESPLAQKCYWHRIIPEVGGHFDPCTKQGTPTTRRRPPLVGLEKCSQMHKRG